MGNSHFMSYTIDKGKRLRLPEFRPGDEWIPDWKGENRVELIRQVPAEKDVPLVKLVRTREGFLMSPVKVSRAAIRRAIREDRDSR